MIEANQRTSSFRQLIEFAAKDCVKRELKLFTSDVTGTTWRGNSKLFTAWGSAELSTVVCPLGETPVIPLSEMST